MSNKCDPNCYTNGKGCALSTDGRCLYVFNNGEGQLKFSDRSYHTPKKEKTKANTSQNGPVTAPKPFSGIQIREGLRYLQYKGVNIKIDGKNGTYYFYDVIRDMWVCVEPSPENKV